MTDCSNCGSHRVIKRKSVRAGGTPYEICLDCGATQACEDGGRTKATEGTQTRL